MDRLSELQTCTESMPEGGRAFYSIFVLLFQFMLPMLTLCLAYYQVRLTKDFRVTYTPSYFTEINVI